MFQPGLYYFVLLTVRRGRGRIGHKGLGRLMVGYQNGGLELFTFHITSGEQTTPGINHTAQC